jgi:hypothetical protein
MQGLLDSVPYAVGASDMACGSQTNRDDVFAARFKAEGAVEGADAINLGERHCYFLRKVFQGRPGKIVVAVLNGLENHDEILFVFPKLCLNDIVELEEVDLVGILDSEWVCR